MPFKPLNRLGRRRDSQGRLLKLSPETNNRVDSSWPKTVAEAFELVEDYLQNPEKFQDKVKVDENGRPHLCPLFSQRVDAALKIVMKFTPGAPRPEDEDGQAELVGLPQHLLVELIRVTKVSPRVNSS